jgi:hypothetical protein
MPRYHPTPRRGLVGPAIARFSARYGVRRMDSPKLAFTSPLFAWPPYRQLHSPGAWRAPDRAGNAGDRARSPDPGSWGREARDGSKRTVTVLTNGMQRSTGTKKSAYQGPVGPVRAQRCSMRAAPTAGRDLSGIPILYQISLVSIHAAPTAGRDGSWSGLPARRQRCFNPRGPYRWPRPVELVPRQ